MYKVAILVNENEMAHSAFANTPRLLSRVGYIQEHKDDYYRFVVFDKFNIADLLEEKGSNFLMTFDSMFIATNATNNAEILDFLRNNRDKIGLFISAGKGIFVSSQKKLSRKENESLENVSFLPEKYDYAIVDRPEKSSADGRISIVSGADGNLVLSYPHSITEETIHDHCEHNSFMRHRYRSFIIPKNETQYTCLLADTTSSQVPEALKNSLDQSRKLLLCAGKDTERLVISTMALDWAGHKELLENILLYITEGVSNFAFVLKKADSKNNVINSYILRAKVGKISYRQYVNPDSSTLVKCPQNIFVFSPEYEQTEIADFIFHAKENQRLISVYHIVSTNPDSEGFALYHYTNETSIDKIKSEATNWVTRNFYPALWGKSVWSYNYVISMMSELNVDFKSFIPLLYEELSSHFCKKDAIDGSYDSVINATCNMLEILVHILPIQGELSGEAIIQKYPLATLKEKAERWLVNVLTETRCSKYDRLYVLATLYRVGYIGRQATEEQSRLSNLAYEAIRTHENEGFQSKDTIVLCQILFIVKELLKYAVMPKGTALGYTKTILDILVDKQNDYGQWGNISETAEVTLNLLEIELDKDHNGNPILDLSNATEHILSSIERLFQTYDHQSCSWYGDINTTVKAIHAICLYDRAKNYSANDFFHDISLEYSRLIESQLINQDTKTISTYITAIYEKEQSIKSLKAKNNSLRYFRVLFFGTLVSAISLLVMLILIIAGLTNEVVVYEGQEISVLLKLFNDWQSEFIFGFIGLLFGAAFTGAYSFVKEKTFK